MTAGENRLARGAALTVVALVLLRLAAAAWTPLTFDEAYYWTWSKHLAGGYYDHPPMVALLIRLGTMIAGDTEFGVRLVSVLLALPMSWAVYRTARILFDDARIAASAAVLLNLTLMVAAGTIIVTPDAPLMVASSFVLYFLAKIYETGRGAWWLAVGAAVGCGLLSKYTAFFFGAEILLWLLIVKKQRRWLLSPWPYLGGIVAFAFFSPVIIWNAQHQWLSFLKQFGRARVDGFTLKYVFEVIPAQFAFATPSVCILGVFGLYALLRRKLVDPAAQTLINVSFWTIFIYFIWHSLHERAEANWFGPVYPAFAIAGAVAAWGTTWQPRAQHWVDLSRKWAPPIAIALFVALIIQVNTGILTGFQRDPSARAVGVGWRDMARDLEAIRVREGATCILTFSYGNASWLMFYMPKGTCVAQRDERYRWTDIQNPDEGQLRGKVLFLGYFEDKFDFRKGYARAETLEDVERKRSGVVMQNYNLDLLEGNQGEALDYSPPPELTN